MIREMVWSLMRLSTSRKNASGLYAVEFGRSDQAVERRSPIAAGVAAGKEEVLAPQRDAA